MASLRYGSHAEIRGVVVIAFAHGEKGEEERVARAASG